jgi:hypothetical protein
MEVPKGKSLRSYLKQAKMSFLFPFFWKVSQQEGKTGPAWRGLIAVRWGGGGESV